MFWHFRMSVTNGKQNSFGNNLNANIGIQIIFEEKKSSIRVGRPFTSEINIRVGMPFPSKLTFASNSYHFSLTSRKTFILHFSSNI